MLFAASDLAVPLGRIPTEDQVELADRIVWGWLKGPLGLDARPEPPVPEQVFAWAVELGAIYLENPTGLSSYQLGGERFGFSAERRESILAEAAGGGMPSSAAPRPTGDFPPARAYPDPVEW